MRDPTGQIDFWSKGEIVCQVPAAKGAARSQPSAAQGRASAAELPGSPAERAARLILLRTHLHRRRRAATRVAFDGPMVVNSGAGSYLREAAKTLMTVPHARGPAVRPRLSGFWCRDAVAFGAARTRSGATVSASAAESERREPCLGLPQAAENQGQLALDCVCRRVTRPGARQVRRPGAPRLSRRYYDELLGHRARRRGGETPPICVRELSDEGVAHALADPSCRADGQLSGVSEAAVVALVAGAVVDAECIRCYAPDAMAI